MFNPPVGWDGILRLGYQKSDSGVGSTGAMAWLPAVLYSRLSFNRHHLGNFSFPQLQLGFPTFAVGKPTRLDSFTTAPFGQL